MVQFWPSKMRFTASSVGSGSDTLVVLGGCWHTRVLTRCQKLVYTHTSSGDTEVNSSMSRYAMHCG